jgi:DNA polymerase I
LNYLIPNPADINAMKGQTATKAMIKGKQYQGAIVIIPKGGVHFNIKVVDFGSLYPSIIKFYNIGYETINCQHEECKSNKFAGLPHWICIRKKALESIFIGSLRDLRLGWYKKESKNKNLSSAEQSWYKVAEQTIKVFMNASYGVFAAAGGFAFHCPSASEEIANIARSIIQATADKAKELGIEVIYGDTDSLMLKQPSDIQVKTLQDWALSTYKIDLELDKEYRFACFSNRKKNYLGVKTNGDIDIKGLTGKKSHTPKYFKKTFEEIKMVLKNVQKPEDVPQAKETIKKLVLESYKNLKMRKWENLEDLAFHISVGKKISDYGKMVIKNGVSVKVGIPQHIKAVNQLENAGIPFELGSTISFIKSKNEDGVLALELAENKDVAIDKYLEFLDSTFSQILDPLELELDEILGHKKLTAFM